MKLLLTLALTQTPYGNPNVAQAQALRQNTMTVQPAQQARAPQPQRSRQPMSTPYRRWGWAGYRRVGSMGWYGPQTYGPSYYRYSRPYYGGFGFGFYYRPGYNYGYYNRPYYSYPSYRYGQRSRYQFGHRFNHHSGHRSSYHSGHRSTHRSSGHRHR